MPARLKLAFSNNGDHDRISRLFEPDIKGKIDPHGYIMKREPEFFDAGVINGSAVFLFDPANDSGDNVHALTIGYRSHFHKPASGNHHNYTEIGTTLSRLQGFKAAQIVIAASSLKEWWEKSPSKLIVTDLKNDNGASVNAFQNLLGWAIVQGEAIIRDINANCAPAWGHWYMCNGKTLSKQAQVILDYMDGGELYNKHTQQRIKLDLSAMEEIGLGRELLEALAEGKTDKGALNKIRYKNMYKIGPGNPPAP